MSVLCSKTFGMYAGMWFLVFSDGCESFLCPVQKGLLRSDSPWTSSSGNYSPLDFSERCDFLFASWFCVFLSGSSCPEFVPNVCGYDYLSMVSDLFGVSASACSVSVCVRACACSVFICMNACAWMTCDVFAGSIDKLWSFRGICFDWALSRSAFIFILCHGLYIR